MRAYTLHAREDESRFVRIEYACDTCAGWYVVAGVVSPKKDGRKSYAIPLRGLEERGGWPCACADVAAGVRV